MATVAAMKPCEAEIVAAVIAHEREFGRALPNNSFYKSLALDICRRYGVKRDER